jgi:hypothetical protein
MESIETLNQRLIDHYGNDSDTNRPIFRIVWANDQTEKRMVSELDNGIKLLFPAVREVKKYSYIKDLYVLERLVVVPDIDQTELPVSKLSYEPLWAYCNADRQPVAPMWEATKFIVDTLYAALGKRSMAKYVDDEKNTTKEGREERIKTLQDELFGNETETSHALRYKQGIIVPNSYEKDK